MVLKPFNAILQTSSNPWKYKKLKILENCRFLKLDMALDIYRRVFSKCAKNYLPFNASSLKISTYLSENNPLLFWPRLAK